MTCRATTFPAENGIVKGTSHDTGAGVWPAAVSVFRDCDALGKVTRLVNVVPSKAGQVVAQELEGHNVNGWLQAVLHVGDFK